MCLYPVELGGRIGLLKSETLFKWKYFSTFSRRSSCRLAQCSPKTLCKVFRIALTWGVDMVEIDLKKTKDGHLVLMHDKLINRTMNGKGRPEDYTLAELKALRLKNGAGCKTRHQIPTFEEVMTLCKGKIMVNVDKGYDYFKEAYAILEKDRYGGAVCDESRFALRAGEV